VTAGQEAPAGSGWRAGISLRFWLIPQRPPVRVLGFPRNKKEQGEVRGGKDLVPQPEQKAAAHCWRRSDRKHPGCARDRQPWKISGPAIFNRV
jgi:hypothetical protein